MLKYQVLGHLFFDFAFISPFISKFLYKKALGVFAEGFKLRYEH
jgi:hypothetical protein